MLGREQYPTTPARSTRAPDPHDSVSNEEEPSGKGDEHRLLDAGAHEGGRLSNRGKTANKSSINAG